MKPLIYTSKHFKPIKEEDTLVSSILESLESIKLDYSTSVFDDYDLVHFLNLSDINKISDAKRSGMPTVVNALYCEYNKKCSMIIKKGDKKSLKPKVKKCLDIADVVLVPGPLTKKFLIKEGVQSDIRVFPLPLQSAKFNLKNETEINLFTRYFTEREDVKFSLTIGDYLDKKQIETMVEIASHCPFMKFYFFGENYSQISLNKYSKKCPKNLIFSPFMEDDVYRSTLSKAKIFLIIDTQYLESPSVYYAMAANTQVLVYGEVDKDSFIKDKYNAHIVNGIYEITEYFDKLVNKKIKNTRTVAKEFSNKFSLEKSGENLKSIYYSLLDKKKEAKGL